MIAVCLLTCDRLGYTETTVRTFQQWNADAPFLLLHGDDASADPRVPAAAQARGFETIVQSTRRQGWLAMRLCLFEAARRRGAEWVLFLENDIEWARAFPWALFEYVRKAADIYCLRLYGAFKDRAQLDPCMVHHKADRRKPVKWKPLKKSPEPAQIGWIHWAAQPSVTRIGPLLDLHRYGMETKSRTARVVNNVTYHIGVERTAPIEVPA